MRLPSLSLVCLLAPAAHAGEPELLVTVQIDAIASNGTDVFWVAGGHVHTLRAGATEPERLFPVKPSEMTHLLADTTGVVVAHGDEQRHTVLTWSRTGTEPNELCAGDGEATAMAADEETVFLVINDPVELGRGALLSVPRAGGSVKTVTTTQRWPWSLTLDDKYLYFTTMGSAFAKPLGRPDGTIARVNKSGGRLTILFSGQFEPDDLVISGNHLYWSDGRAARGTNARSGVWKGKKTGGEPLRLARVDDVVTDLEVCAARVIAAIPGNPRSEAETEGLPVPRGSIRSVPIGGGRLTPITSRVFARPMHLAVTDQALWWVDGAGLWSLPSAEACAPAAPPRPRRRD